jgi:hypothetical protein
MPRLFNPALLRPQPILVIVLITLATHIVLKPLYGAVDNEVSGDNG